MKKGKLSGNRKEMMLNDPIEQVIPHLAVPTIISMLITTIYNMADTYFVSKIGTSASGSVGIIFSAMAMIQAVAFTIGVGSGTNVSQCLGAGDEKKARTFVATGFTTAFLTGTLISVLALTHLEWLVRFLGATETIAPYAIDYGTYIFFATPFQMCALGMNNMLRFEGLAAYSMWGIATGGILNMALDPLFIFGFHMGTAGAALATGLSQFISFSILLCITMFNKQAISIDFRCVRPTKAILGRILYNGFPSMGRQGLASVATIVLNNAAGIYGDAAIAAFSIVNRFIMFINSTVVGFGQGFQPVCGFCYGAGRYTRVRHAYWFCVKVTTCILLVLGITSFLAAGPIVQFFRDDPEVVRIGTVLLRFHLLTIPLWGFITMSNMFSQSIGYGVRATLISASRQGFCLIPLLLILPQFMGLTGLQICQPCADVLSFIFAFVIVNRIQQQMAAMPDHLD